MWPHRIFCPAHVPSQGFGEGANKGKQGFGANKMKTYM